MSERKFNYDLERMRKAVDGPTIILPRNADPLEFMLNYDRDTCLVCGGHHNHGNLPCPTMQVTAHVQVG